MPKASVDMSSIQPNQKLNKTSSRQNINLVPVFRDVLVLPLPSGLKVSTKLKPEHEQIAGGHLLLSCLGFQSEVQSQVLKTEQRC